MAFWGKGMDATDGDPKRKFRWKVSFGGLEEGVVWYAKTVSRPEMTVGDSEHKFYGHTFKFPGSVTWNDIDVELVDPADPDVAKKTLAIFHNAGYRYPGDKYHKQGENEALSSMTKGTAVQALQGFQIQLLSSDGKDIVEQWDLHNAFLSKIAFDQLDYGSDDLTTISLTVKYDWATFTAGDGTNNMFGQGETIT
jgi:hypothetical protein